MARKIVLSPAQRYALLSMFPPDEKIPNGPEGRRFRRAFRQLGLTHITDISRESGIPIKTTNDTRTCAVYEIEEDTFDWLLKLSEKPRTPAAELLLGDVFDLLDDMRAGREVVLPNAPDFDLETDKKLWELSTSA